MSIINVTHSQQDQVMTFGAFPSDQLVLGLTDLDTGEGQMITLSAWQARQLAILLHEAILDGEGFGSTYGSVRHLREMIAAHEDLAPR